MNFKVLCYNIFSMLINNNYIKSFSNRVDFGSRADVKTALIEGKQKRLQSGKNGYFWDLERRELHAAFDAVYARGIEKLAKNASNETLSLTGRVQTKMPLSEVGKTAVRIASIGLSGFAGWLVGLVYTQSMTNDIIHEYGHYWADNMMMSDSNPVVSTNAQYWLQHGEWRKWFWGDRDGGPGNWTSHGNSPLTEFGKLFSPVERDLFTTSAGLGAELIVNTTIAGLGLYAIRKQKYTLGAALLGFALISHSAAFSYIDRIPELLVKDMPFPVPSGDPAHITADLSNLLGWTTQEAYHLLYYGYLFFPVVVLGFLCTLFFRAPQEIPDECVLMHLLMSTTNSEEMRKMLAEVEVEMAAECTKLETLEEGKEKQELTWKICHNLIEKIKENSKTLPEFEKVREQVIEEVNGKLEKTTSSILFRMRGVANIAAFIAYQIFTIGPTLIPALANAFYYLSGTFVVLNGISVVMEGIQTIKDLFNEKLSQLAKALSVGRTVISLVTLVVVTLSLFVPGLNFITVPAIVISLVIRTILYLLHLYEVRRRANDMAQQKLQAAATPRPKSLVEALQQAS